MNLGSLLGNESAFGRLMTKCGTLIAVNVLFALSIIPFFTVGAAFAAMYHTVNKLHDAEADEEGDGSINPFLTYLEGFKHNFVRATACFMAFAAVIAIGCVNLEICSVSGSAMRFMAAGVIAMMLLSVVMITHLIPVLGACDLSLRESLSLSLYVAVSRPLRLIAVFFLNAAPLWLLYQDEVNRPTYAFAGAFFAFALIAYIIMKMLRPHLHALCAGDADDESRSHEESIQTACTGAQVADSDVSKWLL